MLQKTYFLITTSYFSYGFFEKNAVKQNIFLSSFMIPDLLKSLQKCVINRGNAVSWQNVSETHETNCLEFQFQLTKPDAQSTLIACKIAYNFNFNCRSNLKCKFEVIIITITYF
jgi:hypothetical protein